MRPGRSPSTATGSRSAWTCAARTLAARGWTRDGGDLCEVLARLDEAGCARYVVTDITKDGTLRGPNLDLLRDVAPGTDAPVIACGGVSTLDDLRALAALEPLGVEGVDRRQGAVRRGVHRWPRRWRAVALGRRASRGPSRAGRRMTVAVRVIPCLDVDAGRVVKGVNFVDLRDAGDPVELAAAYDAEGADELIFLDITASSDDRATMLRRGAPHRRAGVHPAHRRRRGPHASTTSTRCCGPAPTRSAVNTAAIARPELIARDRRPVRRAGAGAVASTRAGPPATAPAASR